MESRAGGDIRIESRLGSGTTVRILLPESDYEVVLPSSPVLSTPPESAEPRRILVDDSELRELAVTMLQQLGYEVEAAPDGAAALARLESGQDYDLVFTDVIMADGVDGSSVAAAA